MPKKAKSTAAGLTDTGYEGLIIGGLYISFRKARPHFEAALAALKANQKTALELNDPIAVQKLDTEISMAEDCLSSLDAWSADLEIKVDREIEAAVGRFGFASLYVLFDQLVEMIAKVNASPSVRPPRLLH